MPEGRRPDRNGSTDRLWPPWRSGRWRSGVWPSAVSDHRHRGGPLAPPAVAREKVGKDERAAQACRIAEPGAAGIDPQGLARARVRLCHEPAPLVEQADQGGIEGGLQRLRGHAARSRRRLPRRLKKPKASGPRGRPPADGSEIC